jgi:hypothetical protein
LEERKIEPAKVGWLRARGQVQRREFNAARDTLEAVIGLDTKAVGPRVLLSHALLQMGKDWPAAEKSLRDVLELDPDNREARHNLQVLLRDTASGRQPTAKGNGATRLGD